MCKCTKSCLRRWWNVISCVKQSKREIIIKQLRKCRIQIAALSETCVYDSGMTSVCDYMMIYSGAQHETKLCKAHTVTAVYSPMNPLTK